MVTISFSIQWYWLLLLAVYITWFGFLAYASLKRSWNRLKIGIKLLSAGGVLVFGFLDVVVLNWVIGSLLFVELPRRDFITFSQRCSYHFLEDGFRGTIARAFSIPLNAIDPNHIRK